jgi:hypothetical protein
LLKLKKIKRTHFSKEEKTIRIWVWWAFNNRVRNGSKEMFLEENDKDLWGDNCRALLNLLKVNLIEDNDKLRVAELYRNLGEFEKCIEVTNSIFNEDFNWIKEQIKYQAENK